MQHAGVSPARCWELYLLLWLMWIWSSRIPVELPLLPFAWLRCGRCLGGLGFGRKRRVAVGQAGPRRGVHRGCGQGWNVGAAIVAVVVAHNN